MKKLLLAIAIVIGGGIGYKKLKHTKTKDKEEDNPEEIKLSQEYVSDVICCGDEDYVLRYKFRTKDLRFDITLYDSNQTYEISSMAVFIIDKDDDFNNRCIYNHIDISDYTDVGQFDKSDATLILNDDDEIHEKLEIYSREYEDFLDNIHNIHKELTKMYSDTDYRSTLEYVDVELVVDELDDYLN